MPGFTFSPCVCQDSEPERLISNLQDLNISALKVYRSLQPEAKGDNDKNKSKCAKPGRKQKRGRGERANGRRVQANPVTALQSVAKKLGLGGLSAR